MKDLKIVVIGADSGYTPELMEDITKRQHEFPVHKPWLVDIEEGREKMAIIAGLTRRMLEKDGLDVPVYETLSRQEALKDANFVCSQFRAGCLGARVSDERISLKYNIIGQETNGLDESANVCQIIPVTLEAATKMEQFCPNGWLPNFTNPSGMITETILRHSKVRTVGLCNVSVIMQKGTVSLLNVSDVNDFILQMAGLSHFIFARHIWREGCDELSDVIRYISEGNDPLIPRNIPPFKWPADLLENLVTVPCPYLRYYYMSSDVYHQELSKAQGEGIHDGVVKALEKQLFDIYRNPELAEKPKALEGRGGQYYSDAACELMSAICNDKHIIIRVNIRSNGVIAGLPDNYTVEVNSLITRLGPAPLSAEPFPDDTLRLIQLMKGFEELTIEAAVTDDHHTAWRTLVISPLINSGNVLDKALAEVIEHNKALMPAFRKNA